MTATALLHIGPAQTILTIGQKPVIVAPGATELAQAHFKRWPPTPLEMENAIQTVEDELAISKAQVTEPMTVETTDPVICALAASAGLREIFPLSLDRDTVERLFNRLVDIAEGAPAQLEGASVEWAAALLILREMMHHWAIAAVHVGRVPRPAG